ncbi:MAG: flagellar hook-associated protein FlgK [Bacillota bacterium]
MIRGLNAGFYMSMRAMQSAQMAMSLHSQNIAHANDPNYTRRSLENPLDPTGKLPSIGRLRDLFIDDQYRHAAANTGDAETRRQIINRVEDIFGDPLQGGLGLALDRFFDSFKALAENPADEVVRLGVLSAGRDFVQHIKTAYTQLEVIEQRVNEQMVATVDEINTHLRTVYSLNSRISAMQNSNQPDAELKDQRDKVLDQLAKLTGATHAPLEDGSVRVMIGSMPAVDGASLLQLELVSTPDGPAPKWVGFDVPRYSGKGVLPALVSVRDGDIRQLMSDIDSLAKQLADKVNQEHMTGFGLDGVTGRPFFLIGAGPADIGVDPTLEAAQIAASSGSGYQSDGTVARQIYLLSDSNFFASQILPGQFQNPRTFYRNMVGWVGSKGQEAQMNEELATAHMRISQEQRSSRWGVSVDEEVAMLSVQQKAFAAAARVMGAMDQMLDVLINGTR